MLRVRLLTQPAPARRGRPRPPSLPPPRMASLAACSGRLLQLSGQAAVGYAGCATAEPTCPAAAPLRALPEALLGMRTKRGGWLASAPVDNCNSGDGSGWLVKHRSVGLCAAASLQAQQGQHGRRAGP